MVVHVPVTCDDCWLWDKGMVWRRTVAHSLCRLWLLYRFMMVVVGLPWWIMFKI